MEIYNLITFLLFPLILCSQTQIGFDIDGQLPGNRCGTSISLSVDGTRMAIGSPRADGNGSDSGNVRIFEESGGTWTQVGADIDGEAAGDQSGGSVSLSSDGARVAIGARSDDVATDAGHVRIFEESSGVWTQIGADIDGEAASDLSGFSVSLSSDGSRVAIGAVLNDGNGSNSGNVRIFEESSGVWTQVGANINGEAAGDQSGFSVSLSSDGSRVAIGANFNDANGSSSGHTRIFEESGGTWTQVGADIDGDAAFDQSGVSVSISNSGNRVAIGATGRDGNGSNAGVAKIYEESGGIWTQVGADINGESAGDQSGRSVALSADGTQVAIGAPLNGPTDIGHVRIYEESSGTWTQVGTDIDGEANDDQSGFFVAISKDGSRTAIGAPLNDGNGTLAGHVRVYGDFPLPVELIEFTAQQLSNNIHLQWQTAVEQNNMGFEIQKSSTGRDWETIGFIDGYGWTSEAKEYTTIDPSPFIGLNYYRLKQIDYNGDFEFSNIVVVEYGNTINKFLVFPNPSKGKIQVRYDANFSEIGELIIIDSQGRTIFKDQFDIVSTYKVNSTIFHEPGLYLIMLDLGYQLFTQKVMIVRE